MKFTTRSSLRSCCGQPVGDEFGEGMVEVVPRDVQHLSGPIGAAPVHPDQVLFSATGASAQPDRASVLTCVVGTAGTVAIG